MKTIFVLASGRSGTKYLAELFEHNSKNCITKHEPRLDMSGKPVYWYYEGKIDKIRRKFILKKFLINRKKTDFYVETNHLFLKSFFDVALESFPDMKLVHLIRNPLEVAKSQLNRTVWIGGPGNGFPNNFLFSYTGSDGNRYCSYALTGKEKIFQETNLEMSRYQQFLTQWIELENRAMNLLEKYNKFDDCYTFETPSELNNSKKVKDMFKFLGVETKGDIIILKGYKNTGKTPTVVMSENKKELKELIKHIPNLYLEIFSKNPYKKFKWVNNLVK